MWKVPVSVPGFGNINYPSVCPLSPKRNHAFCEAHCEKVKLMGKETELKKIYHSCGVEGLNIGEGIHDIL